MKELAWKSPQNEFNQANEKYLRMQSTASLEELANLWSEILIHAQRVFNKLTNGADSNESRSWLANQRKIRKNDGLLVYIHQARHADEHGISPVTQSEGPYIAIGAPGENVHIDRLIISGGRIAEAKFRGPKPTVTFSPAKQSLIPVENRGKKYSVPNEHLGQSLGEPTVLNFSAHTINYLETLIANARKLF